MRQQKHRGFTLIELMVTIIIVAILVGLAIPSFRDFMIKSRLRGATDDIVNLLRTAHGSAVKLQRDVNVSVQTSGWCAGAIAAADPGAVGDAVPAAAACDCTAGTVTCKLANQNSLVSAASYSGVSLSTSNSNAINNAQGGITFNSKYGALLLGSLPTNPVVTLTAGSNNAFSTQISISQLGETYVCRPTSSKFISGYPSC
jgi:type IV fimbrial biogenesis protein FimT